MGDDSIDAGNEKMDVRDDNIDMEDLVATCLDTLVVVRV